MNNNFLEIKNKCPQNHIHTQPQAHITQHQVQVTTTQLHITQLQAQAQDTTAQVQPTQVQPTTAQDTDNWLLLLIFANAGFSWPWPIHYSEG